MKKLKLILIAAMATMLCGCMGLRNDLEFDKNGNMRSGAEILVTKEALEYMGASSAEDLLQEVTPEALDEENVTVESFEETINETLYYGVKSMEKEFSAVNEDITVNSNFAGMDITIPAAVINEFSTELDQDGSFASMSSMGAFMEMNITMPFNIKSVNIESAKVNGKTVTIDLLTYPGGDIVIKSGNTGMVYLIAGIAVAIVGIAALLFMNQANKKKNVPAEPVPAEPVPAEPVPAEPAPKFTEEDIKVLDNLEPKAEEPAAEPVPEFTEEDIKVLDNLEPKAEEPVVEETPAEPTAEETPVEPAEEPIPEVVEEPVVEEAPVEEVPAEEPVTEPVTEEAPAVEPVTEETPAEPVAEETTEEPKAE